VLFVPSCLRGDVLQNDGLYPDQIALAGVTMKSPMAPPAEEPLSKIAVAGARSL
jgi:hypothetical protein